MAGVLPSQCRLAIVLRVIYFVSGAMVVHHQHGIGSYGNCLIYDILEFPVSRISHSITKVARTPIFLVVFVSSADSIKRADLDKEIEGYLKELGLVE